MNMKFTRTLLMLALTAVIGLSVTGGTIAWFTDSVSSTGNVIKAGTLDVKLYADGTEVEDGSPALFNYNLWEPGYIAAKQVKIENAGTLALQYTLGVNPSSFTYEGTANLAEVIDVYFLDSAADRAAINAATPLGTLKDFVDGTVTSLDSNSLLPGEYDEKYIVLKMQESAGNEYQNCGLSDIAIMLEATQFTSESDSFNNQYDAGASNGTTPSEPTPVAKVEVLDDPNQYMFMTQNTSEFRMLDTAYKFSATEEDATGSQYATWNADFVVTFDRNVEANTIGLAGSYDWWQNGAWIGFDLDDEIVDDIGENGVIPANTPYRLIESYRPDIKVDYKDLCDFVEEFRCGAYKIGTGAAGTTMTVELRLYETTQSVDGEGNVIYPEVGPDNYISVRTQNYTF